MIKKIVIKNFKKFEDVQIDFGDKENVLFVGQNNGGKTTVLQALSLWSLLIQQWKVKKGKGNAKKRPGAPIVRNEVYAVPIRDLRMLWRNGEVQGDKSKRIKFSVTVFGVNDKTNEEWDYGVEVVYSNRELFFCNPTNLDKQPPEEADNIFHLPPLSGVQTSEKRIDLGAQRRAIGEGRPGEILRNLLWELNQHFPEKWIRMNKTLLELFGVELQPIKYNSQVDPEITVFYRTVIGLEVKNTLTLEIANAGSGFLQFLLIAAFLYAHENSVLLIDEPDSHMHVFLQKGMYHWLGQIAGENHSQLIVSTHSEVLVNATDPEQIVAFFGDKPYRFISKDRKKLIQALREISPLDIINAQASNIIYAEGETDFRIVKEWASILEHSIAARLNTAFFVPYNTNSISEPKKSFASLKSLVRKDLKAFCIRDKVKETENLPDGFTVKYWERNEIENYLIHPEALLRFVKGRSIGPLFEESLVETAEKYLKGKLPPDVWRDPLRNDINGKGSDFLEAFFAHLKINLPKGDYYKIAQIMLKNEINLEIVELLNKLEKIVS